MSGCLNIILNVLFSIKTNLNLSQESGTDEIGDASSKLSGVDKVSASPPALRLPQLFTLTPNSSGKGGNMQKRYTSVPQINQVENVAERKSLDQPLTNNRVDNLHQGFHRHSQLLTFFPFLV